MKTPDPTTAVSERLAADIFVEALAELIELSPFHFSRVFQ